MSDTRKCDSSVEAHIRHFEGLYAADPDPWRLQNTWTEAHKRTAVGRALGPRKLARGLELGCGNGVTTRNLARHFLSLTAIEAAPSAAALARRNVSDLPHVEIVEAVLPVAWPDHMFDAIVASEILYYLPADVLARTLANAFRALKPGGLFVSANHVRRFSDSECTLARVTDLTRRAFGFEDGRIHGGAWRVDIYRVRGRRPAPMAVDPGVPPVKTVANPIGSLT